MKKATRFALILVPLLFLVLVALAVMRARSKSEAPTEAAPQPALSVTAVGLQAAQMPLQIPANGNIMAWQEASVGTEANGLRLIEVHANVGDRVRRGDLLAVFASDTVQAELAQSRAAIAEASAALAEAAANAERARALQPTRAMSAQEVSQYLTAERTAQARLDSLRAAERLQQLRLAQTRVLAPDDGLVSARSATVGAVLPAGQELFRLIRGGRLEWRAQVAAADLARIRPGMSVNLTPAGAAVVQGRVRMLAPTVDAQTREGLVYVDLPADAPGVRAGMFARGEFGAGTAQAQTLPQSAVMLREGFSYVLQLGAEGRVKQVKVEIGRRAGERVEILSGLAPDARVVAAGGGFLGDGDLVRVVEVSASAPAQSAAN